VLWRMLSDEARERNPNVLFFAETLGSRIERVNALANAGLDYLFNSSKFWNFDEPWLFLQHEQFGAVAPSISFPESHDTPRLFAETGGNLAVQRQRYLFAAIFSGGVMMPIGYEFGFQKPLHVVKTTPDDWEETGVDLRDFIREVNRLKQDTWVLQEEGRWSALGPYDRPVLPLLKRADEDRLLVLVNKDWNSAQTMDLGGLDVPAGARLRRIASDGTLEETSVPGSVELNPAEILLIW
jgi:starch synthase (maltosyl-transferring)